MTPQHRITALRFATTVADTPTSALFAVTHRELCHGRWSAARALLDDLARRTDVGDKLADVASYETMCGHSAGVAAQLLQDRIDLVNAHARR